MAGWLHVGKKKIKIKRCFHKRAEARGSHLVPAVPQPEPLTLTAFSGQQGPPPIILLTETQLSPPLNARHQFHQCAAAA